MFQFMHDVVMILAGVAGAIAAIGAIVLLLGGLAAVAELVNSLWSD